MLKSVKFVVVLVSVIVFALALTFALANSVEASEVNFLVSVRNFSNEKTLTSVSVQSKQRYLVKRVQKLTGTKKYLVFLKNGRSIMTTQRLKKNTYVTVQKYTVAVNIGSFTETTNYFKLNRKVVPEMTHKIAVC
ncbi:hypothetical protein CEF01_13085 [Lactobacillus crispatus]|uniref:hypothetical protein n=1 Tax=Lactobacillus crispatus TaxID=47770 RepID=UPI00105B3413|nr:hypothetical protein [Lactobacillus crispatus]TDM67773.1 hypothetical protein CEF01_13085 [Lactobacillus crispatus]TDM89951.1 hypothetical protein CEE92_11720 [Lactobacillus crispatus]